jgi:hypothetical protein
VVLIVATLIISTFPTYWRILPGSSAAMVFLGVSCLAAMRKAFCSSHGLIAACLRGGVPHFFVWDF